MQTKNGQPHFWMLEDVQRRCKTAADILDQASVLSRQLLAKLSDHEDKAQFKLIQDGADIFRRVSRSYQLHLRETNVAQMLRQDLGAGRPLNHRLVSELSHLLDADAANQNMSGRVMKMRQLYATDPERFLRSVLIPTDTTNFEKGPFSLTTR